jgi:predicted dehydrogenase
MIKVGLIGIGGMGSMHSECYELLGKKGVKVTAVADTLEANRLKAVRRHRCAVYESAFDLIEKEEIALIDICVPTFAHTPIMLAAMERGSAVICEKPLCLSNAELTRLLRKQKETGVRVGVAQCIRFWDEYEWLKEAVEKKSYGRVYSAVLTRVCAQPSCSSWFADPAKSGSAALDLHIHDVDILCWLFGTPDKVSSAAVRNKAGILQHIFSNYRFGPVFAGAEGGWDYPPGFPFRMTYRVNFEKGAALFDSVQNPALTVYPGDRKPFNPRFRSFKAEAREGINISSLGPYYKELDYFTSCIREGKDFVRSSLEDVALSMKTVFREIRLAGGAALQPEM